MSAKRLAAVAAFTVLDLYMLLTVVNAITISGGHTGVF
jgi:hypothetical protein